jgi:ribonuclease BN (tRNA processing enzyme)
MECLFVGTGAADYETAFTCDCAHCAAIRRRAGRNLRHYASLLVDGRLLIDCGPTVAWRLAELDVPPAQVEALVITHSHEDHLDVAAVRSLLVARAPERGPLPVYGNGAALAALAPLAERLQLQEVTPGEEIVILGRACVPVRANHIVETEDTLNWLIRYSGGWLLYGTDTGWPLPETWVALRARGLSAAIIEATFGTAADDIHPDCLTHHLNWREFLRLRDALVAAGILPTDGPYLATHISQHYAPPHDDFAPQAQPPVMLAHDGLRVRL